MSVAQRVLAGLAVAICLAAGSVMVKSPTGLEKNDKPEGRPGAVPRVPAETDWVADSEEALVARVVYDPVKVRGMQSFTLEDRVALKELMQRTEALVRSTSRSAKAAGQIEAEEREAVERAVAEYAAGLERFSVLR